MGQWAARALAGRFVNVPAGSYQSEKSLAETELGLDGVMGKVVEWKKAGVLVLVALPGGRAVVADTAQDGVAIFSFGEFDDHSQNLVHR